MAVKVVKNDTPLLVRAMLGLSRDEVVVGVFADGPSRKEAGAPPNALIAYVMETGDPARNIPERPFLSVGMQDARGAIIAELKGALVQGFKDTASLRGLGGGDGPVLKALRSVGTIGRDAVRARMQSGPFTPLAPTTIRARRARGNPSTHPLIDTKQLHDAVDAQVRPKR